MTARFEKAYNALYNAFMNDTLAKGTCAACAVGNIVADAIGGKILFNSSRDSWECDLENGWWGDMFVTTHSFKQRIVTIKRNPEVKSLRKRIYTLTGYKWNELAKVEKAFEKNTEIEYCYYDCYSEKEIKEDQFKGVMAVMDVLIELDDIKEGEKYKDAFKGVLTKDSSLVTQ
jgi:hypothetical protein